MLRAVGTPALQLPAVFQELELVPVQLSTDCAQADRGKSANDAINQAPKKNVADRLNFFRQEPRGKLLAKFATKAVIRSGMRKNVDNCGGYSPY